MPPKKKVSFSKAPTKELSRKVLHTLRTSYPSFNIDQAVAEYGPGAYGEFAVPYGYGVGVGVGDWEGETVVSGMTTPSGRSRGGSFYRDDFGLGFNDWEYEETTDEVSAVPGHGLGRWNHSVADISFTSGLPGPALDSESRSLYDKFGNRKSDVNTAAETAAPFISLEELQRRHRAVMEHNAAQHRMDHLHALYGGRDFGVVPPDTEEFEYNNNYVREPSFAGGPAADIRLPTQTTFGSNKDAASSLSSGRTAEMPPFATLLPRNSDPHLGGVAEQAGGKYCRASTGVNLPGAVGATGPGTAIKNNVRRAKCEPNPMMFASQSDVAPAGPVQLDPANTETLAFQNVAQPEAAPLRRTSAGSEARRTAAPSFFRPYSGVYKSKFSRPTRAAPLRPVPRTTIGPTVMGQPNLEHLREPDGVFVFQAARTPQPGNKKRKATTQPPPVKKAKKAVLGKRKPTDQNARKPKYSRL